MSCKKKNVGEGQGIETGMVCTGSYQMGHKKHGKKVPKPKTEYYQCERKARAPKELNKPNPKQQQHPVTKSKGMKWENG